MTFVRQGTFFKQMPRQQRDDSGREHDDGDVYEPRQQAELLDD